MFDFKWKHDTDDGVCLEFPDFTLFVENMYGDWNARIVGNELKTSLLGQDHRLSAKNEEDAKAEAMEYFKERMSEISRSCLDAYAQADFLGTAPPPEQEATDDGRKIIWTNMDVADDRAVYEYKKDRLEEEPGLSDEEVCQRLYDENWEWREDEIRNLNGSEPFGMIVITSLGLWNGNPHMAFFKKDATPASIFKSPEEDYTTYYAKNKDVCMDTVHHDGTNRYLFRKVPVDADENKMSLLRTAIAMYNKNQTAGSDKWLEIIMENTESLYPDFAKVYGWE